MIVGGAGSPGWGLWGFSVADKVATGPAGTVPLAGPTRSRCTTRRRASSSTAPGGTAPEARSTVTEAEPCEPVPTSAASDVLPSVSRIRPRSSNFGLPVLAAPFDRTVRTTAPVPVPALAPNRAMGGRVASYWPQSSTLPPPLISRRLAAPKTNCTPPLTTDSVGPTQAPGTCGRVPG